MLLRVFLKAIQLNLKVFIAYPKGFAISIIIHPFILLLNIYLFKSIYAYNGTSHIKGYDLTQMIWYYAVTTFVWVFTFNFADRRMSNYILDGQMGPMLLRPMSLFRFELANAIALRITGVLFEFVPDMIIYPLIYPPDFLTWASFGKFLVIITLAFFLHFLINYLIGLSAMVTQNNSGVNAVKGALVMLLGGSLIPLDFFPSWLQRICDLLPFKYIFYEPIRFFINHPDTQSGIEFLHVVLMQLAWILGLYAVCRMVWALLIRKVVVAGG
ncbi:ABC transporter permease [Paenibacillus xylaniclasticus]|uniref:ABC transporter permease n=1 Tax=Paenibacillus xylaniclasticus TaxID=588083 RepID=UPI000FD88EA3|nr:MULTISPECIES: hypothetical protein [Paenibacillus]GFN32883.1 membrane protein [Paenibacillus curdlanolyticus]